MRAWVRNDVAWRTIDRDSQYDPNLTDAQIEAIEMQCLDDGDPHIDVGDLQKFYWNTGTIVGACSGETTQYVFVEWNGGAGGLVHGRPISIRRLREMQVAIQ